MFKVIMALSLLGSIASAQVSVKEAKDQGRTNIFFSAAGLTAPNNGVEAGLTLVKSGGTTATTSANSFICTAGKTFRITAISVATRGNSVATAQATDFSFRYNASGAVTVSSTPVILKASSATVATASAFDRFTMPLSDGYEIKCDGVGQFGVTANSAYSVDAPSWYVNVSGFEY